MAHAFISLAIIAAVAAAAPFVAQLIPRKPVPETVLLLVAGALLGPHLADVIWMDESVDLLADLGCAMLFLLAGYEIEPRTVTGREGRRGLLTWVVSFALGFAAVHLFAGMASGGLDEVAVSIALTTTAIGALMPILKERRLLGTRVGDSILSYGTWGELGPIAATALLLSTRATWVTAIILLGFVLLAVLVAHFGHRTANTEGRIRDILFAGRDTTAQTFVRATMALLILLVAVSALFDLDIVLGAFSAGFVLRYIIPEDDADLVKKLDAIGYGFLIPVFFVRSGAKIDLSAVAGQPGLLVGFIALLVLVRAVPIFVSMARDRDPEVGELGARNHVTVAVYCTTALPLIVAVTSVAVGAGAMSEATASVFVSAGALTVLLMPLVASLTYRATHTRAVRWLEHETEGEAGDRGPDADGRTRL